MPAQDVETVTLLHHSPLALTCWQETLCSSAVGTSGSRSSPTSASFFPSGDSGAHAASSGSFTAQELTPARPCCVTVHAELLGPLEHVLCVGQAFWRTVKIACNCTSSCLFFRLRASSRATLFRHFRERCSTVLEASGSTKRSRPSDPSCTCLQNPIRRANDRSHEQTASIHKEHPAPGSPGRFPLVLHALPGPGPGLGLPPLHPACQT